MAISKIKGNGSTKRKDNLSKNSHFSPLTETFQPISKQKGNPLSEGDEFQDLFKKYSRQLKQSLDFDRASIALLDKDNENVIIHGLDMEGTSEITVGTQLSMDSGSIGKVIKSGKVFFSGILKPPREGNKLKEKSVKDILYKEGIRNYVVIPLYLGKIPVGTLNLGRKSSILFTQKEIKLIYPHLYQLAMALENIYPGTI